MQLVARQSAPSKILIVEDHYDSREALKALFEAFGYDVIEATNGREAVENATSQHPNLVLMDIMMPELDGFEATRAIRLIPGMTKVPIIAVTAMDNTRELALQAGMSDYVLKPVDIRRLLAMVSGYLQPAVA
jgi:CheY-like chemotaxis protein